MCHHTCKKGINISLNMYPLKYFQQQKKINATEEREKLTQNFNATCDSKISVQPSPKLQMVSGQLIPRNLSQRTEGAICLAYPTTGKAASTFVHASSISASHAVALHWWGLVDRGCNSPQGAINATQRGWLANSTTSRSRIEVKSYIRSSMKTKNHFCFDCFSS